ncbi:hypothetical protein F5B20DRAFT_574895 [Whalleya microplaca]|nr:hypothetical protein F5B20DRAFT_574895 [Whalleya microplaca]
MAALATTASSHMIMATPKIFSPDKTDNSPLTGQNYPCKVSGDPASFYKRDGIETTMAVGEKQTLSFKGTAVHGGGSCQLAVTKDKQPSASTSWQVILSIEGGCPSKTGDGSDTYDFTIPDSIEAGQYVFAWTWISKLAGQPEYYMNCAPITVTGGGGKVKREANETMELLTARDGALPELFVANLATINDCKTEPSTDPEYPDPGPNVQKPGTKNNFAKVTGSNCVPKGATQGSSSGGDAGSSATPADSSSSAAPAAGSASAAPGSGSGNNGMYNPGADAGSGSGSGSSGAASSAAAAPSGFQTSVVATSAQPAETSAAATQASSAAPAASSGAAAGGSTAGGLTGACQSEGTFNCIGGSSYQQCASGTWSTVMQMPATTKCKEGQSMTLWGRDTPAARKIGRRSH